MALATARVLTVAALLGGAVATGMGCSDPGLARDGGADGAEVDGAIAVDAGVDAQTADALDAAPAPVTYASVPGGGMLDNTVVTARVLTSGSLELGRAGAAPIVLQRSTEDRDIVCITALGVSSCDGAGPKPAVGPEDAGLVTQSVVPSASETCVRTVFAGLPAVSTPTSIDLVWDVCLSPGSDEVVCRLTANGETATTRLDRLYFPYAPTLASTGRGYAVLPIRHGTLLPVGWTNNYPHWTHASGGGGATFHVEWELPTATVTMPMFGVVEDDGRALLAVVRTEADAAMRIVQPLGGAPRVTIDERASLGRFDGAGPRELAYVPLAGADHVAVARRYREHVQRTGRFVSLATKAARWPRLERLVEGGVELNVPTAAYLNRVPPVSYVMNTFAQAASNLEALVAAPSAPITTGLVHVDGWGQRGYDNLHPDIVVPAASCTPATDGSADCGPQASLGGWAGLAALADTIERLGFLFEPHDNYRDFYLDAPSYGTGALALHDADGALPASFSAWDGGPQRILCASQAMPFLRRTLDLLAAQSSRPTAMYLDVLSAVGPDECGAPAHRMTRAESLVHRAALLEELSARDIVPASEEAADWAVPHLAHVFWSGYLRVPRSAEAYGDAYVSIGTPVGVPAPLIELVYHDALAVPWPLFHGDRGENLLDAWTSAGIVEADLSLLVAEPRARAEVAEYAALERALRLEPMTDHRYLDDRFNTQQATYAAGSVLSSSRDTLTVSSLNVPGIPSTTRAPAPRYRLTSRIANASYVAPDKLDVDLEWLTRDSLAAEGAQKVFLHALDSNGGIVANGDHLPATPSTTWAVGVPISDGGTLTFAQDGTFELVAGLYSTGAGNPRLPVESVRPGNQLVLGTVTVTRGVSIAIDSRPSAEVTMVSARLISDHEVEVMTEWKVDGQLPLDAKIFLHAVDGSDAIVVNADYLPSVPATQWPVGARRRELRRTLDFAPNLVPGTYRIVTGLFDTATSARLGLRGSDGANRMVLGSLTLQGSGGQIAALKVCPAPLVCP